METGASASRPACWCPRTAAEVLVLQPLQPETFLSAELPAAASALFPENSRPPLSLTPLTAVELF